MVEVVIAYASRIPFLVTMTLPLSRGGANEFQVCSDCVLNRAKDAAWVIESS